MNSYFAASISTSSSAIATSSTSVTDYNVDDKLNKVEKDIDDVTSKIASIDQQIDKIEIDLLNEKSVLGQEYLTRLTKREETLRSQKAEYRSDLDALRSKERHLLELKVVNQFSNLSTEALDLLKSRILSEVRNESSMEITKSNSKLTNEFHKILNTLPETNGFDFENTNGKVKNDESTTDAEEKGKLVRRFAETGLISDTSIMNDIFDVNTGLDIYDGFYVI
jgi:septal ring factor EnvC (AmiA/AmiB activator)